MLVTEFQYRVTYYFDFYTGAQLTRLRAGDVVMCEVIERRCKRVYCA